MIKINLMTKYRKPSRVNLIVTQNFVSGRLQWVIFMSHSDFNFNRELYFQPETCKVILRSFGFVTCYVMMSCKSSELGGSRPEVENLNPMYYKIKKNLHGKITFNPHLIEYLICGSEIQNILEYSKPHILSKSNHVTWITWSTINVLLQRSLIPVIYDVTALFIVFRGEKLQFTKQNFQWRRILICDISILDNF